MYKLRKPWKGRIIINKSIKRILTVTASLLFMAGIGVGCKNIVAHGANIGLDQYPSSWERRAGITHWFVGYKRGWHHATNSPGNVAPNYYARTFRHGRHTYLVRNIMDAPGVIIGMDGNRHVSNYRVLRSLEGRYVHNYRFKYHHPSLVVPRHHARRHHARRHIRRHGRRHLRRNHKHHARRRR